MEEEQKRKKCCYCGNFRGYYTKGLSRYEKTEYGFCAEHDKIVEKEECCERWKKAYRKRIPRSISAYRALSEILVKLTALRQIIEENEEENKHL